MPLLHHEPIAPPARRPTRWLLFLHGAFGSGRNWSAIARRVVELRPDWGALLIDLREHGQSTGFPAPHTLDAAAQDVLALVNSLGVDTPALLGHSLGGKVALACVAAWPPRLRQAFIADSTPDPVPETGEGSRMLATLRRLPPTFTSRDQAVAAMAAHGVPRPTGQWMAMNLTHKGDAFRWRMDLDILGDLLDDFRRRDLWHALDSSPSVDFHFLRATRSGVLTPQAINRLGHLGPHVHVHDVDAAHWLNADNPDAVVDILARSLIRQ